MSHADHNCYHGHRQECLGNNHSEYDSDGGSRYRVSVRRSNSLKESAYYRCDLNKMETQTVSKSAAPSVTNLTRSGISMDSSEKKAHVLFHRLESRDSPDSNWHNAFETVLLNTAISLKNMLQKAHNIYHELPPLIASVSDHFIRTGSFMYNYQLITDRFVNSIVIQCCIRCSVPHYWLVYTFTKGVNS